MVASVLERGYEFRAGDYVLTGALAKPQDLRTGDKAVACFPEIGEMSAVLS